MTANKHLKIYLDSQIAKISATREGKRFDEFRPGDTIKITYNLILDDEVIEGEEIEWRTQSLTGVCIGRRRNSLSSTFKVRKIDDQKTSFQRTFMYYSPMIQSIEVIKKGKVRRAKLYYLKDLYGKSTRIKERK
jgi:large subunit ribosomal protein L19